MASSGAVGARGRDDGASQAIDLGDGLPRSQSGVARRGCRREQVCRVGQAGEPLRTRLRVLFELDQPLRERDQRAGQVAAVDGRDVPRVQRRAGSPCRTSSESVPDIARDSPGWSRWRSDAGEARRSRDSRGHVRPASTAGSCRCWSATCGAPASERRRLPGSCRAPAMHPLQ